MTGRLATNAIWNITSLEPEVHTSIAGFDPVEDTLPYLIAILFHKQQVSIAADAYLRELQMLGLRTTGLLEELYRAVVVWRMIASLTRDRKDWQWRKVDKSPRLRARRL
jgi:hypothetical protein